MDNIKLNWVADLKRGTRNVTIYHFRVFVGKTLVFEVADLLNNDLRFRAIVEEGWINGTVELPTSEFPPDAFRTVTQEILGYSLGKPSELKRAVPVSMSKRLSIRDYPEKRSRIG